MSELLAQQMADTRVWTLKLIVDLEGEDWTYQPAEGVQHALWLCGHLATAQEALVLKRSLGRQGVIDPEFASHFDIGAPIAAAAGRELPTPEVVLKVMADVHAQTLAAIRGMSDELLAEPAFGADGRSRHPHYDTKLGAVTHLARHEAFHAGQLALLRRMLGKPFLR